MVKETKISHSKINTKILILSLFLISILAGSLILISSGILIFEKNHTNKIYSGVRVDGISFGGKTQSEVEQYFNERNDSLSHLSITLFYNDKAATLSASDLSVYYDSTLSAVQANSIGRSGHFFSDILHKWQATTDGINIHSALKINTDYIDEIINNLALGIDITPEDALFQFENGKVTTFKLSKTGRSVDRNETRQSIISYINALTKEEKIDPKPISFSLIVKPLSPIITTENSNNYGIKELIGIGTSKFVGSIPGRIHNIELASSRINGRLVPPGITFSFNDALGDVSASTGFQPAYVIKDGRTVLGDGGGVCQVSTTLFRATLNAGLPIIERHAHAYRVGYYEQDTPPGLDATVFAPSVDFKFKNDSNNYILIQAITEKEKYALTFELYGTKDGRKSEVSKPLILSQIPPPDDLYQDDPTLPKGVIKQVDWKAWGAKVTFEYQVTKNNEVLTKQTYISNFRPWQAVFLRGTKE